VGKIDLSGCKNKNNLLFNNFYPFGDLDGK